MSINFLISQAKLIQEVIDAHAPEIEKLDQEIGDGDHIFNVQRGIKLVIELEPTIKELPISKALNQIAMKVLSGIGGSSGALFGTLFMTMAKGENIDEGVDYKKAFEIFAQGVEAVKQRGKADVGEKTMMDVLIPVANCLQDGVQNNKGINEILTEAVKVAEKGYAIVKEFQTKPMSMLSAEEKAELYFLGLRDSKKQVEKQANIRRTEKEILAKENRFFDFRKLFSNTGAALTRLKNSFFTSRGFLPEPLYREQLKIVRKNKQTLENAGDLAKRLNQTISQLAGENAPKSDKIKQLSVEVLTTKFPELD